MMDGVDFDTTALSAHLNHKIPGFGHFSTIKKFSNGQSNPTFLIETDQGRYVLRKQPSGPLLKSAPAVDREYRVMQALAASNIPVPKMRYLCEDTDILGSLFFVMDHVPGEIFWNATLPQYDTRQRGLIYQQMNTILAALHDLNIDQLGLREYGRPGNYFARQIDRWTRQYRASETETISSMDELIHWLPENLPDDDHQVSLIHGDFRIDNFIFDPVSLRANALLDWELSTLGHPFADLAYQCMQWRMDQNAPIAGLGGVDRTRLGIPCESQYVADYCDKRGMGSIPHWDFYLVFSFFRFAAILQGVMKRAIMGNASSTKAIQYGRMAPVLADMAVDIIS